MHLACLLKRRKSASTEVYCAATSALALTETDPNPTDAIHCRVTMSSVSGADNADQDVGFGFTDKD